MQDIPSEPAPWRDLILVCRKCSAKREGGFGAKHDQTLREVLKTHIRQHNLKGVLRAVETDCLDLCPEGAVSTMRISTPDRILPVSPGTGVEAVLQALGLAAVPESAV